MKHRAAIVLGMSALLLLAGCSEASRVLDNRDANDARPSTAEPAKKSPAVLRGLDDRWPAVIKGRFGTSRTGAYDTISVPSLSDMPYEGRGLTVDSSYAGVADARQLAQRSRVIARGTVVAISRPHFNSDDGSFWDPALVSDPGIVPSESFVMRDVTLTISTVYGTKVNGIEAGKDLTFVVRGGQVQVVLDSSSAEKMGLPEGGAYTFGSAADVPLTVGAELVVFLNSTPIHGLYDGRYGYQFKLYPSHEIHFAFRVHENGLTDIAANRSMTLDPKDLPDLAQLLGMEAGPEPKPGTLRKQPHVEN